jgi:hypothetical protein
MKIQIILKIFISNNTQRTKDLPTETVIPTNKKSQKEYPVLDHQTAKLCRSTMNYLIFSNLELK